MPKPSVEQTAIEFAIRYGSHAPTIYEHVKALGVILDLSKETVLQHVERTAFFKPEGLVRCARHLGFDKAGIEELEIRLGLRKPKEKKNEQNA